MGDLAIGSRFPAMGAIALRENFGLVQVLRGVAALWVVLFHASEGHHIDNLKSTLPAFGRDIFNFGGNGVAIFFALSGFVIAHSIRGDTITPGYIGRFALRRSIRLDPAYWLSIAFFLGIAALSAFVKHEAFVPPTTGQLAANMTYTQLFLNQPSINVVYWTLCYEVQFYLVLVLCIMAAQRFGQGVLLIPFAAAILWGSGLLHEPFPGLFVDRWHCFFLGALAYWSNDSKWSLGAFVLLCGAVLIGNANAFTVICAATTAALLIARQTGFITNGLASRPTLFLGTVSYSLYLTHNSVTGASFFITDKLHFPEWLGLIVCVTACIAFAAVFWWIIERPTMKLAKRVKLRPDKNKPLIPAIA